MGLLGKSGFRPLKIKLEFLNLDFIKEEIFLYTLIFFLVWTMIRQKSRVVASFIRPQMFSRVKHWNLAVSSTLNMNRQRQEKNQPEADANTINNFAITNWSNVF